jgi:hypothetical protein
MPSFFAKARSTTATPGAARRQWRPRDWLCCGALQLLMVSGCGAHTDTVAIPKPVPNACPDADGCIAPASNCAAQSCTDVASQSMYCAGNGRAVQLGADCDAKGQSAPGFALCSCGSVVGQGGLQVDVLGGSSGSSNANTASANVAVGGTFNVGGEVQIAGALHVSGSYSPGASGEVSGGVIQDSAPQCRCDQPDALLDIDASIAARAQDHDNDGSLPADALDPFTADKQLSLDCGRYYFTRIAGNAQLSIKAHGHVAVFVAGNIELDDALVLSLADGASFELFVGGTMRVSKRLELSTTNDGDRVLLAVAGPGTIDLSQDAIIDGSLYAPNVDLVTRGSFEAHGALFVHSANFGGASSIHDPVRSTAASCDAP